MITPKFNLVILFLFGYSGVAQTGDRTFSDGLHNGSVMEFEMGYPPIIEVDKGIVLMSAYLDHVLNVDGDFYRSQIDYDTTYNFLDSKVVRYSTDSSGVYWQADSKKEPIFFLKNYKEYETVGYFNLADVRRVKQVQYNQNLGRPNLSELNDLKSLVINNYQAIRYKTILTQFLFAAPLMFDYCGDFFLWDEIFDLKNLQHLQLGGPYHEQIGVSRPDYTYLDIPLNKVFSKPNLRSFMAGSINYLPVHFHAYEQFNFFKISSGIGPEMANLALVFHHYGKDTTLGNWSKILKWVHISKDFEIPINGAYESYYANGNLLCKGEFLNGLPNGKWTFWYDNTTICEEREYDTGKRIGDWYTMSYYPNNNGVQDTLNFSRYEIDQLVYMRLFKAGRSPGCQNREDWYRTNTISEYYIQHVGSDSVSVNFQQFSIGIENAHSYVSHEGDTLNYTYNRWGCNKEYWTLEHSSYCYKDQEGYRVNVKGDLGEIPYYFKDESYRNEISNYTPGLVYKENYMKVINLRSGYFTECYFNNDSGKGVYKKVDSSYQVIPNEWIWKK